MSEAEIPDSPIANSVNENTENVTSGGAATPTFRALVSADIPIINMASRVDKMIEEKSAEIGRTSLPSADRWIRMGHDSRRLSQRGGS
jgi:hypothetical protein